MNVIHLHATDIALAAPLALANALASLILQLRVHRQVLWATVRMVVQLLLVGWVLRLVFQTQSPLATGLVAGVMVLAAAREVAVRPDWRLTGGGNYGIATVTVSVSSVATVLLALFTAIRPEPWHDPRYAVPLFGIVLGSVLNSASLGLDTFFEGVGHRRAGSKRSWHSGTRCAWHCESSCRHPYGAGSFRSSTRCRQPASSPCLES